MDSMQNESMVIECIECYFEMKEAGGSMLKYTTGYLSNAQKKFYLMQ